MKNRILSIILTLIMVISAMSMFAMPASAVTATKSISGFEINPVVLLGGDDTYNIVWKNTTASDAYITYTYGGKTYTVWDEENGVKRFADKMHSVRIPQAHLPMGSSYTIVAGSTKHTVTGFNGFGSNAAKTVAFISDVHFKYKDSYTTAQTNKGYKLDSVITNVKTVIQSHLTDNGVPYLRALVGDITDDLATSGSMNGLLKIISAAGEDNNGNAGHYPVLYALGNHEKRGEYIHHIDQYLAFNTGESYGYVEWANMAFYVTDIGEDKIDTHSSYTASATDPYGTIDMERYNREQYEYFSSHKGYNTSKTYTFTIGHGPSFVGYGYSDATSTAFAKLFDKLGSDLHVFGHIHNQVFYDESGVPVEATKTTEDLFESYNMPFPGINVASVGEYNSSERGILMTVNNNTYTFTAKNESGANSWTKSRTVDATANGGPAIYEDEEEVIPSEKDNGFTVEESTDIPTGAGMSTGDIKIASSTAASTMNPVVFDAGKYYSIVWQTSTNCVGYVDVDGVAKPYMEQYGGVIRLNRNIHTVRVPKDKLNGKSYSVKTRQITHYNGHGYGATDKDTGVFETYTDPLTFSGYTWGTAVQFVEQPTDGKYTVVAVGGSGVSASAINNKLAVTPNLVVFTGNMVSSMSQANFKSLLTTMNAITGGSCPVMYLRGANDITGDYSVTMPEIIRNFASAETINKMYTTAQNGKLSVIGLDTSVNAAEQASWIANDLTSKFASKYNLVFGNAKNTSIANSFAKHKVQLSVTAGSATAFTNGGSGYSQATVASNDALILTCDNNNIKVESVAKGALSTINTADVTYAQAKVGDKYYTKLSDALSSAKSGDTILLQSNATVDTVIVRPGRTLDLNGHSLTANLVSGFNGSDLVDNSATKTGKLVAKRGTVTLGKDNDQLPIYNSTSNYYVFTTIHMTDANGPRYDYEYNTARRYRYFPFLYEQGNIAERTVAHEILKSQYSTSGVNLGVRLTYDVTSSYTAYQDYIFVNEYVSSYVSSSDDRYATTGQEMYQKLYVGFTEPLLNQGDNTKIYSIAQSDTGVEMVSAAINVG